MADTFAPGNAVEPGGYPALTTKIRKGAEGPVENPVENLFLLDTHTTKQGADIGFPVG
jgi:hypothetical protein